MAWRVKRSDKVLIQDISIPVSSSIMAQISPEFHNLFITQHGQLRKWIELPNEDPVAFRMICESAHGSFIPQDHVSLQSLANMADVIQRYNIPTTSPVHHTVEFSFAVHALKLSTLSTIELLTLLGVATALGSTKYNHLLEDVFLYYPLQLGALAIEQIPSGCNTNCAILANVKLRGVACRAQVASTLLNLLDNNLTLHLQDKIGLASWVLKDRLSLQEINTRIQGVGSAADHQRKQLLDASGAIHKATEDINHYVRAAIGEAQAVGKGHKRDSGTPNVSPNVKYLEVQIAEDERMTSGVFDADDTSSGTDFVDIEAYAASVRGWDDDLQFNDAESVYSSKTI